LTLRVTSAANFDHTDCNASLRAVGVRIANFRSRRPTLVRFVSGRLEAVVIRGLNGTVRLSGSNTQGAGCSGGEMPTPQQCPSATRIFMKGRVSFSSAGAGSITVRPPRVAWRRVACPHEPEDVAALPLGIAPGPLHVSVATLRNPRIKRITLRASANRRKNYASPERGFVQQSTTWTLTLTRTGR
jgi:hypothetical protein